MPGVKLFYGCYIRTNRYLVNTYVLVMYPSLGSARLGSVLARAFKEKARLGSARNVSEKARFLKNAQNEPTLL